MPEREDARENGLGVQPPDLCARAGRLALAGAVPPAVGALLALIATFDPTVPVSGAAAYGLWVLGPLAVAVLLFVAGRGLHVLYRRGRSPNRVWVGIWAVFSIALFAAIWVGFTVLTSIGASDKPARAFLSWTAGIAAVLTLLVQALAIPWLYLVSRMLRRFEASETTGTTAPDRGEQANADGGS